MTTSARPWLLPTLTALSVGVVAASGQTNVIVIVSDDAGYADFGFMRNAASFANPGQMGAIPTPNLDRLASRGVTLTNAYAASVCSPSRAMLTTGMYGQRFGYNNNIATQTGPMHQATTTQGLPTGITTVFERMQAAGLETAVVGKWHLGAHVDGGGQPGNRPQNQGVESFQGIIGGSRSYFVGSAAEPDNLRETLSNGAGTVTVDRSVEGYHTGQYVTDVFGDWSANYIRSKANTTQPFFLYSSFTAPHTPMQATSGDLAYIDSLGIAGFTGNRRTQAAMQYALDRNIGKILEAVDDPDGNPNTNDSILNNTLIVFINDNGGDSSDADPNFSSNGLLRNGKGSQWEGGMRVPMLIAGAGLRPDRQGSVYAALAHMIDVVPTAVAAVGGQLGTSQHVDGINLIDAINQGSSSRTELLISRFVNSQAAIRIGDWKYVYTAGQAQLYNLASDIRETNNVIAQHPDVALHAQRLLTSYDVQFDKPRHDLSAPTTNQFDHFRFREESLSVGTFGTANLWRNGDTNSGSATISYLDSYANTTFTFRAKAEADYTVTNDLLRYSGLPFIANRINLESAVNPLSDPRVATINGNALLLARSRNGVNPVIHLAATDALPGRVRFKLDLPVEIHDDLTLSGDGNQDFQIGAVRGYRDGLSITKTGSAPLVIKGEFDVSGAIDLQRGEVSAMHRQMRGQVRVGADATLIIGGRGFARSGHVGDPPAPPIVTDNLALRFEASLDTPGDAIWTDASGQQLSFSAPANRTPVVSQVFPNITSAYAIPVTGGAGGLTNYFETSGPRSERDASFELFFNIDDLNAGANQVLFEVGGSSRGASMTLSDNLLNFHVRGDGGPVDLSSAVLPGWNHVVGVIDLGATGQDQIRLFLNEQPVGSIPNLNIRDWAGGNPMGIGEISSSMTGVTGTPIAFQGDIASFRYYANSALTLAEVLANSANAKYAPALPTPQPTDLQIQGTLTLLSGSELELDIVGNAHDSITVEGGAVISGTLRLVTQAPPDQPITPYMPLGLMAATNLSGTFDSVVGVPLSDGFGWAITYEPGRVIAQAALDGDADLNGRVEFADLLVLAQNYDNAVRTWAEADFTGDGVAEFADLLALAQNYNRSIESVGENSLEMVVSEWMRARAMIPEPGAAVAIGASVLMGRLRPCRPRPPRTASHNAYSEGTAR